MIAENLSPNGWCNKTRSTDYAAHPHAGNPYFFIDSMSLSYFTRWARIFRNKVWNSNTFSGCCSATLFCSVASFFMS